MAEVGNASLRRAFIRLQGLTRLKSEFTERFASPHFHASLPFPFAIFRGEARLVVSMRFTRRSLFTSLLFLLVANTATGNTKFSLQLPWYHQFQFAGFYAAKEKGFYRDAGLEVEILDGQPLRNISEYVVEVPGRFGISNTDLLISRIKGLDVVTVAAIFQHSAEVLITLKKSGIRKPSDLAGKKVMARFGPTFQSPAIRAMFTAEGIASEKMQWVAHSWNENDLKSGKVDAMSGYITAQIPKFRRDHVAIHVLNPLNYGIDFYGDLLFTSGETIRQSGDEVRAFTKASLEGWRYAFDHVDEMVDRILEMPNVVERGIDRELLLAEAKEMRHLFEPDLIEIGYSNARRWERILQAYRSANLAPENFSMDGFFLQAPGQIRKLRQARLIQASITLTLLTVLIFLWIFQLRRQVKWKTRDLREVATKSEEQKELAERANNVKSLFLANMSHEIRTPLTAILGFVEILKDEHLTVSERSEYLAIIERTGQSLATILNDILDLAKVEAGRLEIRESPCNLTAIIDDIEKLIQMRSKGQNVSITFTAERIDTREIITDPIRFKQIVLNVVGNAVKFTSQGAVKVLYDVADGMITIRVSDTGIGIAPEDQAALFQPFYQADQSFRKEYSGTGLGLAISKRLAQLLGGDVTLERSGLNEGTEFKVRIAYRPSGVARGVGDGSLVSSFKPTPHQLAGKKILVVDDSEDNQLLVKLFLEKEGADVTLVENGYEAVKIALNRTFDLIFMDIQMPVMDGYSAIAVIRRNGYSAPIIALTANAMSEDLDRCLEAGCDDFLSKPVKKMDLIQFAVRYSTRNHSAE